MSRGISYQQRDLLEALLRGGVFRVPIHRLRWGYWAEDRFGHLGVEDGELTKEANRNTNRALRSLERRGLVKDEGLMSSIAPGDAFICREQRHWSLTEEGYELAKSILAKFVADAEQHGRGDMPGIVALRSILECGK